MKLLPLTQGQFAMVDDEDYEHLSQWKWQAQKIRNRFYGVRNFHEIGSGKSNNVYLHRYIMNAKKGEIIDHKNNDGLDCQKHNMRKSTHSQNNANRKAKKNGTSKYLGVSILKSRNKEYWRATISKDNKTYWLGNFKTEESAALAYNERAKELHGEFANLNFK